MDSPGKTRSGRAARDGAALAQESAESACVCALAGLSTVEEPRSRLSQKATEAALGRLICDDAFRRAFREDSRATAVRFGLDLTEIELDSLSAISRHLIEGLAERLDDRIRRADEGPAE